MRNRLLIAAAVVASVQLGSLAAHAGGMGEAGELEAARANARAGGPVSERDAELLQRYGCTSGTDNPACHRGGVSEQRVHRRRVRVPRRDE